jgi:hypothetical protein
MNDAVISLTPPRRVFLKTVGLLGLTTTAQTDTAAGQSDDYSSTTYRFEDELEDWKVVEDSFSRTNEIAFEGSYAVGLNSTSGLIDTIAYLSLSENPQVQQVSFVWKEFFSSRGGGVLIRNSSGNMECFVGSDNPQWVVIGDNSPDGPGRSYVGEGNGYNRWIQTEIKFDWNNSEFSVSFEDIESGNTGSETFQLNEGQDIGQIELHGYQDRRYEPGSEPETESCQMYWDSIEIKSTGSDSLNSISFFSNPLLPAAVGIAVGPIFGYGLYRFISDQNNQYDSSDSSSGATIADPTNSSGSSSHNTTTIDDHQAVAETAIETAVTAKSNNNLGDAADAYNEAIVEYQAAIEALNAGDTNKRAEFKKAIESTRADLEAVKTRREQQRKISETLKPAERSFQEAIVAHIENNQTVARIRFRQARDTFEEAHETITEGEADLLTEPVAVDVQPDQELSSTTISDLPGIPEAAATELAESGSEAVDDLEGAVKSPWTPAAVGELVDNNIIEENIATKLTLLSWWHGDESYEFDTAEAVETRHRQADYGFNQTS